jgi:mono/diheme cytochrome c family protein
VSLNDEEEGQTGRSEMVDRRPKPRRHPAYRYPRNGSFTPIPDVLRNLGQGSPLMKRARKRYVPKIIVGISVLIALSLLGIGGIARISQAADETPSQGGITAPESQAGTAAPAGEAASKDGECCQPGDQTPPVDLVVKVPKGQLKSPYQDFATYAEEGHKQFLRPGCNECHGGTGGGGICPPLTSGVWFWGASDDTLFRLVTLGSQQLQKDGYPRLGQGGIGAVPMPPMGPAIKTSDDLWKIIAWVRSINPPGHQLPK